MPNLVQNLFAQKCWRTMESFVLAEDCNLRQINWKSGNIHCTAQKRQDIETLFRARTQHLCSPRNKASESFCVARIPHHWTQKNTFTYKVQMFFLQTIFRSKHSTCHGSPTCLSFHDKLDPVSFREQQSRHFCTLFIEYAKGQTEKFYGLIFTFLIIRYVYIMPYLNTDNFVNAYQRYVNRRCQPTTMAKHSLVHLRN